MNLNINAFVIRSMIVGFVAMTALETTAHSMFKSTTSNESVFDDCVVEDIAIREWDKNEPHFYQKFLKCNSSDDHDHEIWVYTTASDDIVVKMFLEPFFRNKKSTFAALKANITWSEYTYINAEGELITRNIKGFFIDGSKTIKVTMSSPTDILDDLAEDDEFQYEVELNGKKSVKILEFDGASDAIEEFRKRVKSLQESNKNLHQGRSGQQSTTSN